MPDSFVDVPSSIDGNRLMVDAPALDPDSDGACYFRLRERD
jgi:hypothetical protein